MTAWKRPRTSAKGSHSTWGDLEQEAARACPVCGRRVTLKDSFETAHWPDGRVTVTHAWCRAQEPEQTTTRGDG